mgnify:CR=1 FL=1
MVAIAMTREMGTLGKDVAQGIAEALGLKVIHHEVVEHDLAVLHGHGTDRDQAIGLGIESSGFRVENNEANLRD